MRNWREWPLTKTSAGAMFSSHCEGPGPSLFAPKLASGTHCAPGALFFTLLALLLAPKRTQGRPRDTKKSPKGLPKPLRGHLKSIRNRPGTQPWYSKGPGKLQGYPRDGKRRPNLRKNNKKGKHSVLFFKHFWCDARRHSTQKRRAFRAGSYTLFV